MTARRLLLGMLALGLSLLAAEGVLRALGFHLDTRGVHRLDPVLLHDVIPGARKIVRRAGSREAVLVSINRDGFRGEELDGDRAGLRVVVYGDSFIAAEFSKLEETFVARLGAALGKRVGRPVEAINAGVAAYGPDQISLRLERDLGRLRPDLVVIGIFAGNDFGDLLRNKLFELDEAGELARNDFEMSPSLRAPRAGGGTRSVVYGMFRKLWWRMRAGPKPATSEADTDLQIERWLEQRRAEYKEYVVRGDDLVRNLAVDTGDVDIGIAPRSESARYKVRLMERVLARIAGQAEQAGAPVVLLFIPAGYDVCEEYGMRVDVSRHPGYSGSGPTDALAAIADELELPALDLFGPFRANDPCGLYLEYTDGHWNDAGQSLAADLLADYLVSERIVE